jgi:hypothetical protein
MHGLPLTLTKQLLAFFDESSMLPVQTESKS